MRNSMGKSIRNRIIKLGKNFGINENLYEMSRCELKWEEIKKRKNLKKTKQ